MIDSSLFNPSPILQKVLNEKLPKLTPSSIPSVIKLARRMTRLTLPSGCAQNLKAEFQDPEKALEYSKRKNLIFETYLKSELTKLNCSKFPVSPSRPLLSKSQAASPAKLSVKPSKTSENPVFKQKKGKSLSVSPSYENDATAMKTFLNRFLNNEKIVLPPLVKSVPMHQDPSLCFPKKNSVECAEKIQKIHHFRMKTLDSVSQQCEDFLPKCKEDIEIIEKVQGIKSQEREKVGEYLEDFSDCLKISTNQQNFVDSLKNRCYNRRLDEEFKGELGELKKKLLDLTKDAIDLGGKKVWRWKNTLFLAKTDRLINSVPITRK